MRISDKSAIDSAMIRSPWLGCGVYCVLVIVGGVVNVLIVTRRGVRRDGGGTGRIVTRRVLEPCAVYEYVFAVRKFTGAPNASTERPNMPGRDEVSEVSVRFIVIDSLTSMLASVN